MDDDEPSGLSSQATYLPTYLPTYLGTHEFFPFFTNGTQRIKSHTLSHPQTKKEKTVLIMYSHAFPEMEDVGGLRLFETAQLASGLLALADSGIFIFTVILLCAGIPVPEFRTAVIVLLVSVSL